MNMDEVATSTSRCRESSRLNAATCVGGEGHGAPRASKGRHFAKARVLLESRSALTPLYLDDLPTAFAGTGGKLFGRGRLRLGVPRRRDDRGGRQRSRSLARPADARAGGAERRAIRAARHTALSAPERRGARLDDPRRLQ